jgi:uncharacterized ParB-like nuclease family protein
VMIRIRFAIGLCALALTTGLATPASAAGPAATASKTCKLTISQQRNAGATYLVSLNVTGVTCQTGLKVEKAFQSCRRSTAGHRTCRKRVLGYSCKQTVIDSVKTQYDAKVTCKSGTRTVKFTYTQNT